MSGLSNVRIVAGRTGASWLQKCIAACGRLQYGPTFDLATARPLLQTMGYVYINRSGNKNFPLNVPLMRTRLHLEDGGALTLSLFDSIKKGEVATATLDPTATKAEGKSGGKDGEAPSPWSVYNEHGFESIKYPDEEATRPVILLHHGITGNSSTVGQHLQHFCEIGYRVVVVDRRGHDPWDKLHTPRFNFLGDRRDVEVAINHVAKAFPHAPLYGLGVSVGCGSLACYLAEAGSRSPLVAAALISPCWNQDYCWDRKVEGWHRRVMDTYLSSRLQRIAGRHKEVLCKDNEKAFTRMQRAKTTIGFLREHLVFTGFEGADAMLWHCNPFHHLKKIRVPFLVIASLDDPISAAKEDDAWRIEETTHGVLAMTKHGAHCGFYERNIVNSPTSWADDAAAEFLYEANKVAPRSEIAEAREVAGNEFCKTHGVKRVHIPMEPRPWQVEREKQAEAEADAKAEAEADAKAEAAEWRGRVAGAPRSGISFA